MADEKTNQSTRSQEESNQKDQEKKPNKHQISDLNQLINTINWLYNFQVSEKYKGYELGYFVTPRRLLHSVKKMDRAGYFLEDISCIDLQEGLQVVYHFDHYDSPGRIVVRTVVPRDNPSLPSICDVYPGAAWHERECHDFFGVRFEGHPNPGPLLLDPEFEGPPPLLKEESARKTMEQIHPERGFPPGMSMG